MQGKSSCLLVLVLLCGVGKAGVSLADGPPFIGHLPQGTVELVAITYYPTTSNRGGGGRSSPITIGPFFAQDPKPSCPSAPRTWRGREGTHMSRSLANCQPTHRRPSVGSLHPQRSRGSGSSSLGLALASLIGWQLRRIRCPRATAAKLADYRHDAADCRLAVVVLGL